MGARLEQTQVERTVLGSPGGPVVEGSGTAALGFGSKTNLLLRPQAETAGGSAGTWRCFCRVPSAASLSTTVMQTLSWCHRNHPCCQAGSMQLGRLGALSCLFNDMHWLAVTCGDA